METSESFEMLCPSEPPAPVEPTVELTPEEAFLACSSRWYNTLRKYSFATEGVGLFSVAVVGILANMLSIAVLCQRTMKSQITALLITLAIFDILFLLCTIPVFTATSVNGFVDYLNECVYAAGESTTISARKDNEQNDDLLTCNNFSYSTTTSRARDYLNGPSLASFIVYFRTFQTNITILTTNM